MLEKGAAYTGKRELTNRCGGGIVSGLVEGLS
jgi:hypothetical protein